MSRSISVIYMSSIIIIHTNKECQNCLHLCKKYLVFTCSIQNLLMIYKMQMNCGQVDRFILP